MEPQLSIGTLIGRIRDALQQAVLDADSPSPPSGPASPIDLTYAPEALSTTVSPAHIQTWAVGLREVGELILDLQQRHQEQLALLRANLNSSLLKSQAELRACQERLKQDEAEKATLIERLETTSAQHRLLQEQTRQDQLSSASKMDVLHQKVLHLETSYQSAQERAKSLEADLRSSNTPSPAPIDRNPSSSSLVQSQVTPVPSELDDLSVPVSEAERVESLQRDLRIATDLLRTEHEKLERSETDLRKAHLDLERLKAHLIQVQDESDEKELTLQQEIERISAEKSHQNETQLLDSALSGSDASASTLQQYESALEEAKSRIADLEEELESTQLREEECITQISNLEASLVHLQAEQQMEVELHTVSLRNQVASLKEHIMRTEATIASQSEKLRESADALSELPSLQQKLADELALREAIQFDNDNLRTALNDAAARLSRATEGRDAMIAKPLVAKIICTYLAPTTSASSKAELLHLLANILELTDDERRPLGIPLIRPPETTPGTSLATPARGLVSMISSATGTVVTGSWNKGKQWLSWGRRAPPAEAQQTAPVQADAQAPTTTPSLSDMWIKILLEGSEMKAETPPQKPNAAVAEPESQTLPPDAFKTPLPIRQPRSQLQPSVPQPAPVGSATTPASAAPTWTPNVAPAAQPENGRPVPYSPQPTDPVMLPGHFASASTPSAAPSPYLAQQHAMRASLMTPSRSASTPSPPAPAAAAPSSSDS